MQGINLQGFLQVLLCDVFIAHPEDPLIFLEEKLREIMAKGLDFFLWYILNYSVCECVCYVVYNIALGLLKCANGTASTM